MPDEFWKRGVHEIKDIVRVIVSTSEFDARRMAQDDLDLPRPSNSLGCPEGPGSDQGHRGARHA